MTSYTNGPWDDPATWDEGVVPSAADDVLIQHSIIIRTDIEASSVTIGTSGGLRVETPLIGASLPYVRADVGRWSLTAAYPDHRVIDLSGLDLTGAVGGGISCVQSVPGYLPTGEIRCQLSQGVGNSAVMADPKPLNLSANISAVANIAVSRQVSRWSSAGIRSGTVNIQWPKSGVISDGRRISIDGMLDRMTRQPFKVLAYTPSWILYGHISSVSAPQSGGQGWHSVDITIQEG